MKRKNRMRKKILAFAILITMLFNNGAVSAWAESDVKDYAEAEVAGEAASESETQEVSDSEAPDMVGGLPDTQEESDDVEEKTPEIGTTDIDATDNQNAASQEDIPEASPEEVIELEDYIREQYGEEYVALMNEKLEADEIPGHEELGESNGSDNEFVVDLALTANKWFFENDASLDYLRDNGYTVDGNDINDGAGIKAHYIYLGWKYTNDLQANIGAAMTGILIRKGDRIASFKYNGKTYYPLSTKYFYSDYNLNQETKGKPLYIYFTRDGAEQGDPVISTSGFGISNGRPEHALMAEGYENGVVNQNQDLNQGNGGDDIFLAYNYHTHSLVATAYEDGHRYQCERCNFHKELEKHEFEYVCISDSKHESTCKVCKHKIQEPHMDSNEDGLCDACKTPVEAKITIETPGKTTEVGAYKKFTAAWDDALVKKTDCSIVLLKDISLTSDHIAPDAQHLTPLDNGKTITIKNSAGQAQAKLTVNGDTFNNFSEVFYVTNGELKINTGIVIDGGISFNSVIKASSANAKIIMDSAEIFIKGSLNKNLSYITGDQSACLELPKFTLEFTGSRGSKPYSIYGIHVLNGSTADIALGMINDLDQAFRVYNAKLDIHEGRYQDKTVVYVEKPGNNSEILIQGGEFTGTDGYCLDSSGAKVSIEFGNFTGSFRVGEDQKICSVLAAGRYAAEIDSDNNITRRIPYAELEEAGNIITFAKGTRIIECTNHYASEGKYYSRKTHKGICVYCRQEELFAHEFDEKGYCINCKVGAEMILITNAGVYEYYACLEDAAKAIGERTDVTLKITRDIEEPNPFGAVRRDYAESNRLTIDLNDCKLSLSNSGITHFPQGYNITIKNGICETTSYVLQLRDSRMTIQNASIKSKRRFELEDSQCIVGKDGELLFEEIRMKKKSGLHLIDNGKLIVEEKVLSVDMNQELTMSGQSEFISYSYDESAVIVKDGGILTLSDEALINITMSSPKSRNFAAVRYERGAKIAFAGGGISIFEGKAFEPRQWDGIKVTEFLVPGYSYYWPETENELDEEWIDSSSIPISFQVRLHKNHKYNYSDMGDGTHEAVCKLCNITGPISPHVAQKGSDICSKCHAHFVCKHEINDEGFCKYCGFLAEACVIINDAKSYYLSYSDAWKQAKGKTAIIRLLKDIDDVKENLVIDDNDDITIDNREFRFAFNNDIAEGIVINGGKLTISGGVFSFHTKGMTTGMVVNRGEVIINDSEFKDCDTGIKVADGTLTITDGHFEVREIGLLVQGGHITVTGGNYENINNKDCIRVMETGKVKDLLPSGYYYAVPDQDTPVEIDEDQPWHIMGRTTVKQHKNHTGYWKEGVCSLCNYICTHPSFDGNQCRVCGVKIDSKIFVHYKEGDISRRENFDTLQEALNFACQHAGSELIVSEDIPAEATDKTSYTIPDNSISIDSPIDFTINLGKNTIGTKLSIKKAKVTIKGDGGGISVPREHALAVGMDADVRVENCRFFTEDSKYAAITVQGSKTVYLKNTHANGGSALTASGVQSIVTLDGGYYCTASGDKESSLQAVAFINTTGIIKGSTITATAENAAALYIYRCEHVVIEDTRLLVDDTATGVNSIRLPDRGSSETELTIGQGSGIYEVASGKNITDDYSAGGKISESVDKSVYIGKSFPDKKAQIIGYEPLADIEFPAGTAIDDILARIPSEANAVTLYYPDNKVKVKVAFDKEEIRKAIQKVYDQEIKTLTRGENRVRTKKIDIYAKGIVSGWPEDISVVLEDTLNLRLCVEVRKYSVTLNNGQTKQEYFTGDTVELHMDGHTHGKVFSHWDVIEGDVNLDISLPETSFIMPSDNLVINAVYEEQLELIPEKAATCTEPGNKAYYICDCGQWFWSPEDAKADKPIEDHNKVLIPAAGHIDKDMDDRCDICCKKLTHKNNEGEGNNRTNGKTESSNNSGVFTGDQSDLFTWLILLVGSSLGLYVLIRRRRYH